MGNAQINATGTVTNPGTTRLRSDGSVIGDSVVAAYQVRVTLHEGDANLGDEPTGQELDKIIEEALAEIDFPASVVSERLDR